MSNPGADPVPSDRPSLAAAPIGAGVDGPVVIDGVQHVYQPPQRLPEVEVDRSRFLFITANLDRGAIEDSLRIDLPQFQRLSEARAASDPSIPL